MRVINISLFGSLYVYQEIRSVILCNYQYSNSDSERCHTLLLLGNLKKQSKLSAIFFSSLNGSTKEKGNVTELISTDVTQCSSYHTQNHPI